MRRFRLTGEEEFQSGGNFVQVSPPSVVWNLAFGAETVAWCASTAKMERRSSCEGGRNFCQWAPASVVRRRAPARPTIQQIVSEGAEPASKSVTTPLGCRAQNFPASDENWMMPAWPTRQETRPSGAEMVTSLMLLARRTAALCL